MPDRPEEPCMPSTMSSPPPSIAREEGAHDAVHSVQLSLVPEAHAPHAARQALVGLTVVPDDRLDAIQLLVTELVTNSVVHAGLRPGEEIELSITRSKAGLRVEVADRGEGFDPPPPPEDPFAESGRGLALVDMISDRWGVARNGLTRVWFEIDLN
jgi:anti-sigma regulatory factor (Ser/Thr protein kinase)